MLMLDRRMLLRAGSAAVGAAALAPTVPALAHTPQTVKRAQPGFYRLKLGTIEITVISDGMLEFPAETLFGDRAEDFISVPAAKNCSLPPTPSSIPRSASSIRNGRSDSIRTCRWQQKRAWPSSTARQPTRRWSAVTISPSPALGT
jgi:hypothetical protein